MGSVDKRVAASSALGGETLPLVRCWHPYSPGPPFAAPLRFEAAPARASISALFFVSSCTSGASVNSSHTRQASCHSKVRTEALQLTSTTVSDPTTKEVNSSSTLILSNRQPFRTCLRPSKNPLPRADVHWQVILGPHRVTTLLQASLFEELHRIIAI